MDERSRLRRTPYLPSSCLPLPPHVLVLFFATTLPIPPARPRQLDSHLNGGTNLEFAVTSRLLQLRYELKPESTGKSDATDDSQGVI